MENQSLAKEFNLVLEERGLTKSLSLYKQRGFTKLGYCAGSVFDCISIFQKILEEETNNNLLVQACRLYLENEYIVAALKALSYFTYKVMMPNSNFVEKSDQNDLCKTLPVLYEDLRNGDMETLHHFYVEWKHVSMANQVPTTDLDHYLLKEMCAKSAEGIKMQCGMIMILLDLTGSENENEPVLFPSEDEIMSILNEKSCDNVLLPTPSDIQGHFKLQQPLAIIWDKANGDRYWCIVFVMGTDDGKICIDHLQPSSQNKSLTKWIRPQIDDVQDVILDQIIPVDSDGQ